ncbi:glycosyltransferase family 2 protein [Agrobacterium tumefaciens]|uniref:glycosyltransferase family 2 protein n=1 Tax=Agrobacterium tumefaciens TaxID=358 RepID=UPI001572CDC3|nr:glycosyltransferase family 2 protein [Agrobacterium tumefaciens]WCK16161.1 glycosyltransferase family 2 protein [Agrobacterium tumefaciens]
MTGANEDVKSRPSIQVQSVLYNMDQFSIRRSLEALARSVDLAVSEGLSSRVKVVYGDTSSKRCLQDLDLQSLKQEFSWAFEISYVFFDENIGSANGHNRLATGCDTDYLLILNPDVVVSPRLLHHMLSPFADRSVGMVEAKQLPIEHPKTYDPSTGVTSWATTACALTPTTLFRTLEGFDSTSFFLYCDDVDYSWRVREAGYKVIFTPAAVVFHDKRISPKGEWRPSSAEVRYSAEAALMMAHKWSRPDIVANIAKMYLDGSEEQVLALKKFRSMEQRGELPSPRDSEHKVGEFEGYFYAKHRYPL